MRTNRLKMVVAATVAASTLTAFAQPVQWRVEDGGNGHWYQVVDYIGGLLPLSNLGANFDLYYLQHGHPIPDAALWQSDGIEVVEPRTHFIQISSSEENTFIQQLLLNAGKSRVFLGVAPGP
jgi:hypothetical protein